MTTAVEVKVERTAEDIAKEDLEAEAGFSAGFTRVRGVSPEETTGETKPEDKPEATKPDAAPAAPATDATQAKDEWEGVPEAARERLKKLDTIQSQIDKLAGHIGGFKRQIDSFAATAKAAADKSGAETPSKAEIQEALSDPKKFEELENDFPEWMVPIKVELLKMRADMAKALKGVSVVQAQPADKSEPIDTVSIVAQAEERAYVRFRHPDWKAICAQPDFVPWLKTQTEEFQKLAASDLADDAIKVFDTYKDSRKKLVEEEAAKVKKEKRLQGALTPEGSGEPPSAGISEDEAFDRGFKRARGAK